MREMMERGELAPPPAFVHVYQRYGRWITETGRTFMDISSQVGYDGPYRVVNREVCLSDNPDRIQKEWLNIEGIPVRLPYK